MADRPWWKVPDAGEPDIWLVERIGRGDATALEALYARHGRALLAYLIGQVGDPHLAEEVLQDVMLAVWRSAAQFRGESAVRTWLLAIARRAITARQRRSPDEPPLDDRAAADDTGPLELVDAGRSVGDSRCTARSAGRSARDAGLVFYHG